MSLIIKIQDLGGWNTLQEIADSLTQQEILNAYSIYEAENKQEPDSILEAIDFIINAM